MKEGIFRSIDFWQSAIMTLPDSSFFELLRSVFGKIKTPFNKQLLLNDLKLFLSREDIQKTIACYIDRDDARIIAAVATLREPAPGDLESFFSGDLSYAELQDIVINLEERFILYRFREQGISRLAMNPVLEPVLAPCIADTSLLFPSVPAAEAAAISGARQSGAKTAPVLDDRILAGLLSFVSGEEAFFKAEGGLRKRIVDSGAAAFPGLELEPLIGGLQVLGLLVAEGDTLVPGFRFFSGFGKLKRHERMEYCAAGIFCYQELPEPSSFISPHLLRSRLRMRAGFIHHFLDTIEPERLYPLKTLQRLADIMERSRPDRVREAGQKKFNPAALMDALERTCLIECVSPEYRRLGSLASVFSAQSDSAEVSAPLIAMDTPFSCLVYPEINFADASALVSMFSLKEAGATVRFELTRDSAVRAFDQGLSAEAMIELLQRLSGNRINETLSWTLRDWEKRYGEVCLRRGLVLSLSPERRYLAETNPLSGLIRETLAPGVYLLAETVEQEAAEALQKAGVDIISRCGNAVARAVADDETSSFFPSLDSVHSESFVQDAEQCNIRYETDLHSGPTLIEGFHTILEKMPLSRPERDELAARIDRRLVLNESQLKDASIRYEKLEARGLDYVGKAMIAKQAIAAKSPVELIWPGPPVSDAGRIIGIPTALEKSGGESILVISPLKAGDGESGQKGGESIRIPLGKISLLRRIKRSIFESSSGSAG